MSGCGASLARVAGGSRGMSLILSGPGRAGPAPPAARPAPSAAARSTRPTPDRPPTSWMPHPDGSPGWAAVSCPGTAPGMGCVGPWPRRAGAVGHKPRTPPAGLGCVGPWPRRTGAVGHNPRTPPAGQARSSVSEHERGLDHHAARRTRRTAGRFSQDRSSGWAAVSCPGTAPGMGRVGPWPRRAGAVGHNPRTPRPGGVRGPRPLERGLWVTTPERPAARLAAACQSMNVVSTTTRRAGLAGRLGDLAKTSLPITLPQSRCSAPRHQRDSPGSGSHQVTVSPRKPGGHLLPAGGTEARPSPSPRPAWAASVADGGQQHQVA